MYSSISRNLIVQTRAVLKASRPVHRSLLAASDAAQKFDSSAPGTFRTSQIPTNPISLPSACQSNLIVSQIKFTPAAKSDYQSQSSLNKRIEDMGFTARSDKPESISFRRKISQFQNFISAKEQKETAFSGMKQEKRPQEKRPQEKRQSIFAATKISQKFRTNMQILADKTKERLLADNVMIIPERPELKLAKKTAPGDMKSEKKISQPGKAQTWYQLLMADYKIRAQSVITATVDENLKPYLRNKILRQVRTDILSDYYTAPISGTSESEKQQPLSDMELVMRAISKSEDLDSNGKTDLITKIQKKLQN